MEKEKSRDNLLAINLFVTIISMVINYGIQFLFTPYLIKSVGSEAYGFVSLANNMVNYAMIITIALSSVAGRFITIEVHKGNKNNANIYFNSVLGANIILSLFFLFISLIVVYKLETFIVIPSELLYDVKLLFLFIFINFIITVLFNVFTVATFVTNKLYISNFINCICSILRVVLYIVMFGLFKPKVAYIGIVSCICTCVCSIANIYLTHKMVLELKISLHHFSLIYVKRLISAGIWSSVTKLSQIMSDGLDLLISNIFINPYIMSQLSIAYTFPTLLSAILGNITSLFNPQQTYYYAKGDIEGVVDEIKLNMKLTGYIFSIVLCGIIFVGHDFYNLWVPGQDIDLVYKLTLVAIISAFASGVVNPLHSVFLLTNKLKENSIVILIYSVLDIVIVLLALSYSNLGVYAVAGVSKIVAFIVNLTYLPIYASVCLGVSVRRFYKVIIRYFFTVLIDAFVFWRIDIILPSADNWGKLFVNASVMGLVGLIINALIYLNKNERDKLVKVIFGKLFKKI